MARDFTKASSHYLEISDAPWNDVPFSVVCWFTSDVAFSQDNGEWTLISSHEDAAPSDRWWNLRIEDAAGNVGKLQANLRHGAGVFYGNMTTTNTANTTGVWNHAFLSRADGDHDLILNGDTGNKGTSSDSATVDFGTGLDVTGIGRYAISTPEDYWDGLISWVVGWNVKLTDEEAVQMYNGRHPMTVRPEARVFAAPLWGQHSPEIDLAWLGESWTVSGAGASVLQPPMELWTPRKFSIQVPEIPGSGDTVSRLDAAVASNTTPMPYPVSAGTDRALIVAVTQETDQPPVQLTVDYGGQTMTPIVGIAVGTTPFDQRVDLYYLNDAQIAAAVGSNITPQGITDSFTIHAASYRDALQTPPTIVDSEAQDGSGSPLANIDIASVDGAAVCSIAGSGNFSVGAWGGTVPLTEQTDLQSAGPFDCSASFADRLSTATENVDCECTWTALAPNRSAGAALLLPAASQGAVFALELSSNIAASGENTTGQLTAPATGNAFGGGRIQDDENPTDNVDLDAQEYREDEWCLKPTSLAVVGQTYEFRVLVGGLIPSSPVGFPRWTIDSGSANVAPTVNAGTDATVTLPAVAVLDATVSDDNLPDPPDLVTQLWTKQGGPGTVDFADATAVDTTAAFSEPGSYILRLTADDSELTAFDEVTITVLPAPAPIESARASGVEYPLLLEVIMGIIDGWTPITEADLDVYQRVIRNLEETLGAGASNAVATQFGPKGGNVDLAARLEAFLDQDGGLKDIAYVTGTAPLGVFSENGGGAIIQLGKKISGATSGSRSYHVIFIAQSPGETEDVYDLSAPALWWTDAKFEDNVVIKARKADGTAILTKDDTSIVYGCLAIGYDAFSTGTL